jgi:hypothetical protein
MDDFGNALYISPCADETADAWIRFYIDGLYAEQWYMVGG